ncbi:MAG: hypothetical protein AB7F35_26560 [Acetobacteraceae bacterium]
MSGTIGRRVLVTAAAAGGFALSAGLPYASATPRAAAVDGPASGVVGLWTRFDCDGGASFRLTQLDRSMQPVRELAHGTLDANSVRSVAAAHVAGRIFMTAAVARSWGVAAGECAVHDGRIDHMASGRNVRCLSWMDIV